MENGLINIIIPVYNAEKTLSKCLDSVKAQSYENWNVILIDDFSKDKSREIIKKYSESDKRFTYILNDENIGVSCTRNKGLKAVKGEYVAFLDCDDWWEPKMLEKLYCASKKHNADVVQCRFMYNYLGGKIKYPSAAFEDYTVIYKKDFNKIYYKMLTGINMNHVCMKLIKSELIKNLEFNTELKTAEDLAFCSGVFVRAESYVFVPEVMYHYYRGEGSLTGSGLSFKEKWRANRAVSKIIIENLKKQGINSFKYEILALLRPYIITVSKIIRILDEILKKGSFENER